MASKSKTPAKTSRTVSAKTKAPAAKPAVATAAEKPAEAQAPTQKQATTEAIVKRKDMLARVAARAQLRPNQARVVFDAVLEELGEALLRGEKLRLPPLGTVKVNRHKELPNADIVVCKIRRPKEEKTRDEPLSPAAE